MVKLQPSDMRVGQKVLWSGWHEDSVITITEILLHINKLKADDGDMWNIEELPYYKDAELAMEHWILVEDAPDLVLSEELID